MENRKLIRPSIEPYRRRPTGQPPGKPAASGPPARHVRQAPESGPARLPGPPDGTHAEAFYYLKQMTAATPMVLVLDTDEEIVGTIEWYDQKCLKLRRDDGPGMLVFKDAIKYLYKLEDAAADRGSGARDN